MNSSAEKVRAGMLRKGTTLVVAGYWLALFVATHLPHVPAPFAAPGADKWEHLGAYGTLAFLLAIRQSFRQESNWKALLRIAAIVAVYGVFDELSQIPVGRHADVMDWFADVSGSVIGLAAFAMVRTVLVRRVKPS